MPAGLDDCAVRADPPRPISPSRDAYLPQSGPNAFHSQAYLPSSMSYPLPAASLLATGGGGANAGTALPEEVVTRDDYDRIGRIGGRTGVGWMACCAGMLLFTCTGVSSSPGRVRL
jgi:hypothetical protein